MPENALTGALQTGLLKNMAPWQIPEDRSFHKTKDHAGVDCGHTFSFENWEKGEIDMYVTRSICLAAFFCLLCAFAALSAHIPDLEHTVEEHHWASSAFPPPFETRITAFPHRIHGHFLTWQPTLEAPGFHIGTEHERYWVSTCGIPARRLAY